MTIIISSRVVVAQAVTIINVVLAIIQYTLPLLLAVLMIHFMPNVNTALAWNSINRALHSTLWPAFLRTDSNKTSRAGFVVRGGAILITASTLLLAISSVVLPLGLRDGPSQPSPPVSMNADYVQDSSPLALATTSGRDSFTYGSKCPMNTIAGCDIKNVTTISSQMSDIFRSTPHSPFSIQYRQFFNTEDQTASSGYVGSSPVLILRNNSFAVEGLVIDMSAAHPGLGFINHTIPNIPTGSPDAGGTWAQDILFLEPVTTCVDTNLTFEYVLEEGLATSPAYTIVDEYNITDRGGFHNIGDISLDNLVFPTGYNKQNLDLRMHAYIGASLSNEQAMLGLNISRGDSFPNKTYTVTKGSGAASLPFYLNRITPSTLLDYFYVPGRSDLEISFMVSRTCIGFGGMDLVDIDNVHVSCGAFFGPPLRTDGGNNNVYAPGSTWRQSLHACASVTRASIQTFTFSLPSFSNSSISQLSITREPTKHTVLWGMEKSSVTLAESYPLWGRVDENQDTSGLWTVQSNHFTLPATYASMNWTELPAGSPQSAHGPIWHWVYNPFGMGPYLKNTLSDYTGRSDYSIKSKYQDLVIQYGQKIGAEMILNLIWTDIMSNQLVGSVTNHKLEVSLNLRSLEYDLRFAIPGYLLVLLWIPVFVSAVAFLTTRVVRWTYMFAYFNHLSIGRVVTGQSALGIVGGSKPLTVEGAENDGRRGYWGRTVGRAGVMLDLDSGCGVARGRRRSN